MSEDNIKNPEESSSEEEENSPKEEESSPKEEESSPKEEESSSKEEESSPKEEENSLEEEESSSKEEEDSPVQEELIPNDRVKPRPIVEEMSESYLNYAMSVIVSRALPDVRDGLKPVHRRILFSMYQQGLRHGAKFAKSARTVGDVIGKYHPHGDSAVYESLVRMAQDFSMRAPLIRGQGNFGSIDGDRAAAMRYTESKMEKITDEVLCDIEKETVAFRPNYDDSRQEPSVMPAKIPNLLLNGTMGIAVGMATNIPPHNLVELIDAVLLLADNSEATIDDLMEHITGPDFPTRGEIYGHEMIKSAYVTGRGSVAVRGKAEIEELKGDKFRILVSELPYQVNKSTLITKMAGLVRDKKIVGISDIRDESSTKNNEPVRIVIELKKGAYPRKILNQLFKFTDLQNNFAFNMIALIEGGLQPRLLNLKAILECFIVHRKEVITNRVKYELKIAKARVHILEGLKIALDNIDEVIKVIRSSETKEIAKEELIKKFKLSDIQADAILQMRLQTLAGLERKKIEDELKEKLDFIKECEAILANPQRIVEIMKEELIETREKYGTPRRTKVFAHEIGKFKATDTIPNEEMMVALTKENYIKRLPPNTFKVQHRGGKGIIGMGTKDEDTIVRVLYSLNHNNILYFTNKGRVFQLPVYEIPLCSRQSKGQAIVNFLQLGPDEIVTAMLNVESFKGEYLMMATKYGTIKKTKVAQFLKVRKSGLIAIKLREGDELKWVSETSGDDEIMLLSRKGKCIRFTEKDIRPIGRNSSGVRGIRLKDGDIVVEMDNIKDINEAKLLVIMENGLGKVTKVKEYRLQSRGGMGVKAANITKKTGEIVGAKVIYPDTQGDIICFSLQGQTLRTEITSIPLRGRATQGVIIMRLKNDDKVASISLVKTQIIEETSEINKDQNELKISNK